MIVRFSYEGREVDYDTAELLNTEAILLQRVTGRTMADIDRGLGRGDAESRSAIYWLACRRAGDDTRYGEFQFNYARLEAWVVEDDAAPAGESAGDGAGADPTPAAAEPPPS